MSLFSQFTGSSSENTSLGGYALFSGQNPNLITLPDGKVFLKGGVLAKASDFPNVPSDRLAYLNPLVPVADIGSGGRYTSVDIDPVTGYPTILVDNGYGSVIHMYGANTTTFSDCTLHGRVMWTTYADVRFNKIAYWAKEDVAVVSNDASFSSVGQASVRSAFFLPRRSNSSVEPIGLFSSFTTYAMSTYAGFNIGDKPTYAIAVNPTGNVVILDARTPGNVAYTASTYFTTPVTATLPSTNNWTCATYGGVFNEYYAYAHNTNSVAYSTDGVFWSSANIGYVADWRDVHANASIVVLVASNTNIAGVGTTGRSLTQKTLPAVADWSAVTFSSNLNMWAAVARNSNIAAISTNSGQTWTQSNLPATAGWADIAWSPRLSCFVAVADDGRAAAAISTDGVTWNSKVLPRVMSFGHFEGDGNTRIWAQEDTPGTAVNINIAASTDRGLTWRYYRSNTAIVNNWVPLSIKYLNGNLWYAGGDKTLAYSVAYVRSPDGNVCYRSNVSPTDNQATYPTDLTYFGNIYVGIVNNGTGTTHTTSYVTSTDGVTWTNRTMPASKTWVNLLNTGNSLIIQAFDSATGGSTLYNSSNGITWTAISPWGVSYSNVLTLNYYNTTSLYNPTANTGFYGYPGVSPIYITNDRGASFSLAPRFNSSTVTLPYPGDIYNVSNNTWVRVTSANTIVNYDNREGSQALSTYNSGYTIRSNLPFYRNFGASQAVFINKPLLQGGEIYYLGSNTLLRVDANLYINNLNLPGISGGGVSSAGTYYMRVK